MDPDLLSPPNTKSTAMLCLYLLTPLSINPKLSQNVLLQSQTPHESIPEEMPLIARQWSKMLWLSESWLSLCRVGRYFRWLVFNNNVLKNLF